MSEQLRSLLAQLGLEGPFRMFSRCLECNVPLEGIERARVQGRVPPYVFQTQERYVTCPRCGKVYWSGTHWQRMREMARALVGKI